VFLPDAPQPVFFVKKTGTSRNPELEELVVEEASSTLLPEDAFFFFF
jgi:hypothetical protein